MSKFVTDLPPEGRGKYERKPDAAHVSWVQAMQQRPLEWLIVRECASIPAATHLAQGIKTGKLLAFRDGKYEARIAKHEGHTDPNQRAVYARFLG